MNRPRRFLARMVAFLTVVAVVVAVLGDRLVAAFMANPPLNGLILGVLLLGTAFTFRQVLGLSPEVRWIEDFRAGEPGGAAHTPRLLAPMARMLADRKGRMMLSAPAMRSLLDSIGTRLEESREISRYTIGLLIFLGLLGTFWGLLDTVGSVGAVIGGLNAGSEDLVGTFAALKNDLEAPLEGMGTAFSSSLFGLAGSLVLGFLDLQAGQAQNQFYNDLEEWLSSVTYLSSGAGVGDGDQSTPVYVQALLEKTADSLDELQRTLALGEEERRAAGARTARLTETLAALADRMGAEQNAATRIAESHAELKPALQRLADGGSGGVDEETRTHIRNLDVHLERLVEETVNGRAYLASELRAEIKLLGRMISASSRAGRAAPPDAGSPPAAAGETPRPPAPERPAPPPRPSPAPAAAPAAPRRESRPAPDDRDPPPPRQPPRPPPAAGARRGRP